MNTNADNDNYIHKRACVGLSCATVFHDNINNNDNNWACTKWKSTTNLQFT